MSAGFIFIVLSQEGARLTPDASSQRRSAFADRNVRSTVVI